MYRHQTNSSRSNKPCFSGGKCQRSAFLTLWLCPQEIAIFHGEIVFKKHEQALLLQCACQTISTNNQVDTPFLFHQRKRSSFIRPKTKYYCAHKVLLRNGPQNRKKKKNWLENTFYYLTWTTFCNEGTFTVLSGLKKNLGGCDQK